ncbi:CHAT domain-containing protein [Candidatus Viridilinea mediisalina]|uniref:CHAT domain-containing protein n=1 Tax=Candidatus Viridilinea mediisalina TaxID=2024553 RepID=A0A2A6RL56_9CHLR|nr:CHAT domain-containing protein [Candidatus Viridilinea mediisalina]PDW03663.1 hypothetical protein CJ255_07500 [Candidatus Viridilinea mediisalina]
MAGETTLAALLMLRQTAKDTPEWVALEAQIQALMQQYRELDSEDAQGDVARQVRRLLQHEAPSLYVELLQLIEQLEQPNSQVLSLRGAPSQTWLRQELAKALVPSVPLGANFEANLVPKTVVRRYTDIACPQRAQLNERVTVTVGLTREALEHSRVAQALDLRLDAVQVRLVAPRMTLLTPAEQRLNVLSEADSPPVVFQLLPQELGQAELTLEFRQEGQLVAPPVALQIEVVAHEVAFVAAPYAPAQVDPTLARAIAAPDLTLRVYYDAQATRVLFALWREGLVIHEEYSASFAEPGPAAYTASLYRDLDLLRRERDSVQVDGRGAQFLSEHDLERTLRRIGSRLWEKLIPAGLKEVYARERQAWRNAPTPLSMLLISDEASIPWEMVRPFGQEWQESFWCETFHFARWLPRHPNVAQQFTPATRIIATRVALLAPESYRELTEIKQERALLEALIARHDLQNQSPRRATLHAVRDLLEAGEYDWLHAVSHGNFLPDTPSTSSVLWLEDQVSLSSEEITGQEIISHLAQQRPGFVFNACHLGREGATLSGVNGWASQLVGRGAGLFLAPAWTVSDDLAASFATTFYTQLFDEGQTAAAAVWAARQAIKQQRPSDPTWLAYSLYAHPNVRVQVGGQPEGF